MELKGRYFSNDEMIILARSEQVRSVRSLDVSDNQIGDSGLKALFEADTLEQLEELNLSVNFITTAGVKEVAQSDAVKIKNLKSLSLEDNKLVDEAAVGRTVGEKIALAIGFSAEKAAMIMLTIDEALANVIQHGYDGQKGRPIDVLIERVCPEGRVGIRVLIRDRAKQVDPASIKSRDLEDVRPGGLGVHLINSLMDEVVHRPTGQGMELEMVKYLTSD